MCCILDLFQCRSHRARFALGKQTISFIGRKRQLGILFIGVCGSGGVARLGREQQFQAGIDWHPRRQDKERERDKISFTFFFNVFLNLLFRTFFRGGVTGMKTRALVSVEAALIPGKSRNVVGVGGDHLTTTTAAATWLIKA